MSEETDNWIERAEKDLKAAKDSLDSGNFDWAGFQAHQSAEKALKALHINKFKKILRTHDLVLLARRLNAIPEIVELCSKLNPSYLDTRYPDVPKSYSVSGANEMINFAEEIIKWTKKNL